VAYDRIGSYTIYGFLRLPNSEKEKCRDAHLTLLRSSLCAAIDTTKVMRFKYATSADMKTIICKELIFAPVHKERR
jgi:hypothetical protein